MATVRSVSTLITAGPTRLAAATTKLWELIVFEAGAWAICPGDDTWAEDSDVRMNLGNNRRIVRVSNTLKATISIELPIGHRDFGLDLDSVGDVTG